MPTVTTPAPDPAVLSAAMNLAKMYCDKLRAGIVLTTYEEAAYIEALNYIKRTMQ